MSEFWKNKIRTFMYTYDFDKDGYISEQDYAGLASRFADAYNATPEKKENLIRVFVHAWRKLMKAGDIEKEPRLTPTTLIASIKQQLYDPELILAFNDLIRSAFEVVDVSQDGYLQQEEHAGWFRNVGVPEGSFDTKFAFEAMDVNGDGKISIDEFVAAFFEFLFSEDESSPNRFYFGTLVNETIYP